MNMVRLESINPSRVPKINTASRRAQLIRRDLIRREVERSVFDTSRLTHIHTHADNPIITTRSQFTMRAWIYLVANVVV